MKKSRFFSFVVSVLLGMVLVIPAFAGSKKKAAPPPVHQPPVISSVTANSVTVTEDKVSRTLAITAFTEINVNGRRATITDLKPGMTVSITLGAGANLASRINATGK